MKKLKPYLSTIFGIAVGMLAGYVWYDYNACSTGTCPITSHPLNAIIYGGVMGGLFFSSFKKKQKSNTIK
ncbi:MAG TPA: DUF6132 family protein [Chitinophagales bacterium]|nr:DUF6132 family protein [Chitinophagales bacterium]